MKNLPARRFYSLHDVQSAWNISESDLYQWLIDEHLQACMWLPMTSVYHVQEERCGAKVVTTKHMRHWEGYTALYAHHCRSLWMKGKVYLRDFFCAQHGHKLSLIESAADIVVSKGDLLLLATEKQRFEQQHGLSAFDCCHVKVVGRVGTMTCHSGVRVEAGFKKITYNGKQYQFGDIQAAVIRQLYEAAQSGEPWQYGKCLLRDAGSQSFTLSNIFKRNPRWRDIILSDTRGCYRLHEAFLAALADQPIT